MTVSKEELQTVLQKLADEMSLQAKHLQAHRLLLQLIHGILIKKDGLSLGGHQDAVKALLMESVGPGGASPNPEIYEIALEMLRAQSAIKIIMADHRS